MSSTIHPSARETLLQHLAARNVFWSYDPQMLHAIPDGLLVEHALMYADVDDLKLLFCAFSPVFIREIWETRLVPHQRNHKINCYLGTFFFQIPDVRTFLNERIVAYPRLERLKLLAAADEGSAVGVVKV